MKKNLINFTVTILIAIVLAQFLPWWSVMIAAFTTGLFISLKRSAVFLVPFIAIGLLWVIQAYWLGASNDFILAKKIAILLPLDGNITLLIIITGFIGGLAGGIAGIFGKQCSDIFK